MALKRGTRPNSNECLASRPPEILRESSPPSVAEKSYACPPTIGTRFAPVHRAESTARRKRERSPLSFPNGTYCLASLSKDFPSIRIAAITFHELPACPLMLQLRFMLRITIAVSKFEALRIFSNRCFCEANSSVGSLGTP